MFVWTRNEADVEKSKLSFIATLAYTRALSPLYSLILYSLNQFVLCELVFVIPDMLLLLHFHDDYLFMLIQVVLSFTIFTVCQHL